MLAETNRHAPFGHLFIFPSFVPGLDKTGRQGMSEITSDVPEMYLFEKCMVGPSLSFSAREKDLIDVDTLENSCFTCRDRSGAPSRFPRITVSLLAKRYFQQRAVDSSKKWGFPPVF